MSFSAPPVVVGRAFTPELAELPGVQFVPLISTSPVDPFPDQEMRRALEDAQWLAVTSASAARIVARRLHVSRRYFLGLPLTDSECAMVHSWELEDESYLGKTKIAAVGPATANALRQGGVEPSLVGQGGSADLPLSGIVCHPTSNVSASSFPGADQVRTVVVYRTEPASLTPQQVDTLKRASRIALYSPSALAALPSPEHLAPGATLVAVGATTAAAARRAGYRVRTAASPTPEGIRSELASP